MRQAAEAVLHTLRGAGHEAYFAGGSVRDLLMEREPLDYDIATSARPEAVQALFPRTVAVGVAFGVVVVLHGGHELQVATFRADGVYLDGRHPTSVRYSSAEQDVERRDFTINGLLYDPVQQTVLDYVGGQDDIAARVVRCIGDPRARFSEDRLRLLRAIRFAVRFGFTIERQTWQALRELAPDLGAVSAERVWDELLKMLTGPEPERALRLLEESGLLAEVLPEVAAMVGLDQPPRFHPEGDVFEHTARTLGQLAPPPGLAPWEREALWLAALLHDVGKPSTQSVTDRIRFHDHAPVGASLAEEICQRLRLSTAHVRRVRALVADHMRFLDVEQMRRSTLLRFLRLPHMPSLLALHRADRLAGDGDLREHDFCVQQLARLPPEELRPPRLLDGHALLALGFPAGPGLGDVLRALEDAQLSGDVTTREQAEAWARQRFQDGPRNEEEK